ncbi:tripartite tricarboxylate transporter TctB family protein [Acuticoccus sp.]|uniref:tripartite tricarboxylate transporter TctB family protein n=1 Tax=Acuticoccus sp. TaxID=1904378 RepID=UPI003B516208
MTYAKDRIAALLLLALAVAVFVAAGGLPFKSLLFPRMIAVVMAIGAVLMFLRTVRLGGAPAAASDPTLGEPFFRNAGRFALTVVALALYLAGIDVLGYFSATVVLVVALSLALGFRDGVTLGLSTVLFVAFVWFVFVWIFERPLPKGLLA